MSKKSGLTTRQFERAEVDLDVEFVIAPEHHAQVHFSANSPAVSADTVRGRTTDISSGGVGITSPIYVPRMCEGTLRIVMPSTEEQSDSQSQRVMFEHAAKIRRVSMNEPNGQYALGVAFIQQDDSQRNGSSTKQRVRDLLRSIGIDPEKADRIDA